MIREPQINRSSLVQPPKLPAWIASNSPETAEHAAFVSGAAFAMLDMIQTKKDEAVPSALQANRLALRAAAATSKLEGRLSSEQDIRDAYHLTPPDENGLRHWGPDGEVLDFWRRAVQLRLSARKWQEQLAEIVGPSVATEAVGWVDQGVDEACRIGPVAAAIAAMKTVIASDDRAERVACLMADMVLARSFGWDRPIPLSALHMTKAILRDLRGGAGQGEIAAALIKSAQTAYRMALELSARADALRTVAPKLRSKGSDDAISLFLSEDAVAPSGMLSPYIIGTRTAMTGRAARRLCDRLVELGVVTELTGRPTFRLYGVLS